jgi:hypothetical protein
MGPEILVGTGGVFAAAFAVFHLFFWKLFRWKKDLATLSPVNRAIVQVLNLCLVFVFVIFSYVSLVHPVELMETGLGHSMLILIAAFWYLRAIEQVLFFGLRSLLSKMFFVLFLFGGSLYSLPLI